MLLNKERIKPLGHLIAPFWGGRHIHTMYTDTHMLCKQQAGAAALDLEQLFPPSDTETCWLCFLEVESHNTTPENKSDIGLNYWYVVLYPKVLAELAMSKYKSTEYISM